jgi:hypothetical protein
MKLALFCVLTILFSSCTTLKPSDCNYDYGYADGLNSAKANLPMDTNLDRENVCTTAGKTALLKGYREGYSFALKSRPSTTNITVNNNSSGRSQVDRECLEAFGKKACGYNCESGFGKVKCARRADMECLVAFGDIQCGYNCEAMHGRVICEK